jgi:hypothetical protein
MKVKDLIGKRVMISDPTPTIHVGMYRIEGLSCTRDAEKVIGKSDLSTVGVFIINDNNRKIKLGLDRFNTDSHE